MFEKLMQEITEDEAALYDRQIRLWGLDAQKRLRSAKVLLIGLNGLGAEVCKNVVLAGIKSITLVDDLNVTEDDFSSNFLIEQDDLGKNRAESALTPSRLLNPMVEVVADSSSASEKELEFYQQFDVICAIGCPRKLLIHLDDCCRARKILFFCADVFGFYGVVFSDLGEHEYAEETQRRIAKAVSHSAEHSPHPKKTRVEEMETITIKRMCSFVPLLESLNTSWLTITPKELKKTPNTFFVYKILLKFRELLGRNPHPGHKEEDIKILQQVREEILNADGLDLSVIPDDFANYVFGEISPVCAITGGVLAQEIIKAVSKKDQPHNNFFFYNGVDGSGMVDCIRQRDKEQS